MCALLVRCACPTRARRVSSACPAWAPCVSYTCPTHALRGPHACATRTRRVPYACPCFPHAYPTRALRVSPFGSLLEASWRPLGGLLDASWRPRGGLLEASWRHLRGLLGALERPWALLSSPDPIWNLLTSAFERSESAPEDQVSSKRSPKVLPKGRQSV